MIAKVAKPTGVKTAKFCIATILYQDIILYHLKVYITSITGILILLFLAGKITSLIFSSILIIGGLSIFGLMFFLIQSRKKYLLNIDDSGLRELAHKAMIVYLSKKRLSKKEKRFLKTSLHNRTRSFNRCS